jgi:hypothetical protein
MEKNRRDKLMTLKTLLFLVLTFQVGMDFSSAGIVEDSRRETFESEEAKAGLLSRIEQAGALWNGVNSWLIEYYAVPIRADSRVSRTHRIMAASSPGDFYHMGAHFSPQPWSEDPFWQELYIHHGIACHQWRFNRMYSESRMKDGDVMPGSVPEDILLTVMPAWPITTYKMPPRESGKLVLAADALKSSRYRLLTGREQIEGESCAVFVNEGGDRIWIAPEKGVCVMRREFRDAHSGELLDRIITEKVDLIAPNLWLPTQFRSQFFFQGGGLNGQPSMAETRVQLIRCLINTNVPQSTFIAVHRPGSLLVNDHVTQMSEEGQDLLADISHFLTAYMHLPKKSMKQYYSCICLLCGLLSGLIAQYLFVRMKASEKNRPTVTRESALKH